jgi:hydrogenase expression/formation protein HypC
MCLAVPVRVTEILPDGMARAELDGVSMTIGVMMIENIAVGDYVIQHVGYAIARLDPEEARRTLDLIRGASTQNDGTTT